MTGRKKSTLRLGAIAVTMVVALLIGIAMYYNSLMENLQDSSCVTLQEVLTQEKSSFTRMLKSGETTLVGFAKIAGEKLDTPDEFLWLLDIFTSSTDFERVAFAGPDGKSVNNKGERGDLSGREYFHAALSGRTVISDPVQSKDGLYAVAVATPVVLDGDIVGVLVGSFSVDKFHALFTGSFDGYGYTYVATNDGELIVKADNINAMAKSNNLFDVFEQGNFFMGDSYEKMRENLVEGRGGHTQFELDGQRRMMHYDKIAINDWNIFVVVNPKVLQMTANGMLRNALILTAAVMVVLLALMAHNILSQRRFNRELTRVAYVDEVTGASRFVKFKLDVAELVESNPEITYMLVKLDIQGFKLINQMYSWTMGDQILKAEADSIEAAIDSEVDAFARVHADEFVALVGFKSEQEFDEKRRRFDDEFAARTSELVDFSVTVVRGRCRFAGDAENFTQCYENANFAHRIAKAGSNKDVEFDESVQRLAIRRRELENRMESALSDQEYKMYLQPKYRLRDERMVGAEALVRWIGPDGTMLPPDEFIPIFEENGFVTRLDMYMFYCACSKLREWIDAGLEPIPISVNFSRTHLFNPDFVAELVQIADRNNAPHELLEIELTETAMFDNVELLSQVLERIHAAGFTLSMDDFGTGYSSLGLLKNIPVDVIKIDKNFFGVSDDMQRAATVISSVVEMARRLGIQTIAEGVETIEQLDMLREMECELVQGYYYARPMPAAELEARLEAHPETRG